MLIILEGPDGAGKSTLANQIAEEIQSRYKNDKIEIWKKGPPRLHPLEEYETPLLDYKPNSGHHLILDRWHVGEWIYPRYLGRDSLADLAVWRHIEMFLQSRGAVLVHVTKHHDRLKEIIANRGDDLIEPYQIEGIVKDYHAQISTCHLPILTATSFQRDFVMVRQTVGKARLNELAFAPLRDYVTFIGYRKPNILFLGDVRNRVDEIDPRRPPFMPFRDTSGHYLLKHSTSLFRNAAIANACDVDNINRLWRNLDRPQVVALGRNALGCAYDHLWAERVIGAPHPQFIRRFHNRHGDLWLEAIRQGLIKKENQITWRP